MVRPNTHESEAVREAAVAADAAAAAAAAERSAAAASNSNSTAADNNNKAPAAYTVVVKAPQLKAGGLGAMSDVRFSSGGGGGRVSKENWLGEGATVMRGGDWKWGDQDGGPGNRGKIKQSSWSDWVSVRWENDHHNSYRCGAEEAYDLVYG
jgi:hypothetical protein